MSPTDRKGIGRIHEWIALAIAGGVVVQFFLAGIGLFGAASSEAHIELGWILHTVSILGLVAAVVSPRTARAIIGSTTLLVVLTVQVLLPGLREDAPWLAAFHPLLALAVLYLAARIGAPAFESRRAGIAGKRAATTPGADLT